MYKNFNHLGLLQVKLQRALFDTNTHEQNNKKQVIKLCLEMLIKVYAYCLYKSHQNNNRITFLLNANACDQSNQTSFCISLRYIHIVSCWSVLYN